MLLLSKWIIAISAALAVTIVTVASVLVFSDDSESEEE